MDNKEQNEKKYDISKSNFFANIDSDNKKNDEQSKEQRPPTTGVINEPTSNLSQSNPNSSSLSNQSIPNYNPQNNFYPNQNVISQSNFFPTQNNIALEKSNFFPNQYQINNQYQNQGINNLYQSQGFNYQNNQNFYPQPQPQESQSFLQKVGSTAMNLIKKEDPMNLINDISPNAFEDIIKKTKKEIQCQILEKSKLNNVEIKSIISNPRKVSDSLVKNSYLLYDINTSHFNWYVNRRYSDFIWLRETLCLLFPTTLIPQLPKKKMGNRRFEDDFIEKRLKGLQFFLDEVLKNDVLKTADPLITFLSCGERGFFEQQMKIINPKTIKIDSFISIKSFNGKVIVADLNNEFFNNSNLYFNSVENFFNNESDLIKVIKDNLKNYSINMVEACKNLEIIESGFNRLSEYYRKANVAKNITNVFEQYEIFFKNWKRIKINQTNIIKNKLNELFKYLKNNGNSLVELIQRQNTVQKEYQKIKDELINKKEAYWKKMDITKWEMNCMEQVDSSLLFRDKNYAFSKMCWQETFNLNSKGDLLGYYFSDNIANIKNVFEKNEKFSVDNLVSFSKEIEPTVTDVISVWSNLASNL